MTKLMTKLLSPIKIWCQQNRSFVYFAFSGGIAFWIDFFTFWVMTAFGNNLWLSRAIAFVIAATFTWIFNSRISFRGREARYKKFTGWLCYIGLVAIGGAVNYCASMTVLISAGNVSPLIMFFAVVVGSIAGLFVNFSTNHFIFFKKL